MFWKVMFAKCLQKFDHMFAENYVYLIVENQFVMTTFKACVRTQRSDGLFAVLIRVTHNRVAKYIKTNKVIHKSKLRKGEIKDADILSYCSNLIKIYSDRLNMVDTTNWDVDEVVSYLQNIDEDISFSKYARKYERYMTLNIWLRLVWILLIAIHICLINMEKMHWTCLLINGGIVKVRNL